MTFCLVCLHSADEPRQATEQVNGFDYCAEHAASWREYLARNPAK